MAKRRSYRRRATHARGLGAARKLHIGKIARGQGGRLKMASFATRVHGRRGLPNG
jgi:hypothetical protein